MTYSRRYLDEVGRIAGALDHLSVERIAALLADLRSRRGRLFLLGVGGSASNCSHAVNDFRKLAGIEAYTPVDNVSELTARTNDEGWDSVFVSWLKGSRLGAADMLFVLSVGGGSDTHHVSANLVRALDYASSVGAPVVAVVGRDGGHAAKVADACVLVPVVNPNVITAHTEGFQTIVCHLLVTHPALRLEPGKWESIQGCCGPSSSTGTA